MSDELAVAERFVGALVGSAVGDAVGEQAFAMPERGLLDAAVGRSAVIAYTDDTAMAIGLAECLIERGGLEAEALGRRFHDNWRREPWRGYGPGAPALFGTVDDEGVAYAEAAGRLYGGNGSLGNGAAMRIAPLAVLFHDSPDLDRLARLSASVTHAHPVGGDGAAVQAAAIALALRSDPDTSIDRAAFCAALVDACATDLLRDRMRTLAALVAEDAPPRRAADAIGREITVHESMPFAVYAFLRHPDDFAECLYCAMLNGDDRDTLGAMAGAIVGARLGAAAIPAAWRDRLENRTRIEDLAGGLHALRRRLARPEPAQRR